ncbi:MAG TPA: NADH-quinone oxidoreductase subunit J [Dehalococcoidia bacterium]|nr:NADH-quinone oxidoreductase subunit J [Dehalococcoidia bacterium]
MTIAEIVFYLLALVAIVGAIGVVTAPNIVHGAMFLILTLFCTAGFYILLSSEFLALTQVLVYAGAVAIIVLFGLMLTRSGDGLPVAGAGAQWPLAVVAAGTLMVTLLTAVLDSDWPNDAGEVTLVSINTLAGALFRDWLLPFEVVSLVLLVALVGAIVIAHQEEPEA